MFHVRGLGGKSADGRTHERLGIAARSMAHSASMLGRHELGKGGIVLLRKAMSDEAGALLGGFEQFWDRVAET